MGDKPSSGVKTDCERLLKHFASTGSLLYKDFVKEWQKMKFALIFRGRPSIYELIEFTEELFLIAKSYLFPPHSKSERIGGLYLLYGLYYRQPTHSKNDLFIKIRIEYDEWLELTAFVDKLKESGYLDACYIFYKMVIDKVFHFVCFSEQFGIERNRRKKNIDDIYLPKRSKEDSAVLLEDLFESSDFISSWNKKENEYNKLKKDLIARKLVDDALKVDERNFEEELKKNIEENNHISDVNVVNIGERRRAIKNRSRSETKKLSDSPTKPTTLADFRAQMLDAADKEKREKEDKGEVNSSSIQTADYRRLHRKILYVNDEDCDENIDYNHDTDNEEIKDGCHFTNNDDIKDMPSLFDGPSIGSKFFYNVGDSDDENDSYSDSDTDCELFNENDLLQTSENKKVKSDS
ncbi:proximal sequence element A Pbp45 [Lycorma delicatula]|uniref:proximal sequence element A Pbp45 n=1 Tax=Lycorma delicatula TaxID=130591 RepID=UPI003F510E5E